MSAKMPFIRNPLTIIGVFAGVAEVFGTVTLPKLSMPVQLQFAWFLMAFPTLLVLLFFGTLWLKHHVLYAPSDYKDDATFGLMAGRAATTFEVLANAVPADIGQDAIDAPAAVQGGDDGHDTSSVAEAQNREPMDAGGSAIMLEHILPQMPSPSFFYLRARDLALHALRGKLGLLDLQSTTFPSANATFDGYSLKGRTHTFVQVMQGSPQPKLRHYLNQILSTVDKIRLILGPMMLQDDVRLIVAFIGGHGWEMRDDLKPFAQRLATEVGCSIDLYFVQVGSSDGGKLPTSVELLQ